MKATLLLVLFMAVALIAAPQEAKMNHVNMQGQDQARAFDFLFGKWKVHNKRLKERLKGSTEWIEFEGTMVARPILGGKANTDEYEADSPIGRLQGATLRLYNPKAQEWSLYWTNGSDGSIGLPVVGKFKNGVGEFYDQETFDGRTIFVRYIWSNITAQSCHWEQAFSEDGGKSWETNWIMDFTRM